MQEKWYAIYTKPRWEKKVTETLKGTGINAYCPINTVVRQWSDRKKVVQEPLFTSYVFVRVREDQISFTKKVNGVLNYVYWLGKPAVIRDEEIEAIEEFLSTHKNVKLEKASFSMNETIRITSGSLINKEGKVVAIKNNTIKIALPSLGYVLYAEVTKSDVVKVV